MQPRAIETRYKGYRFRSRLEARWAVFFDALGLAWEYEPEGFELPGGVRYLPDFKVNGTWVEVKPVNPSPDEIRKLKLLCEGSCLYGFFVCGQPKDEKWYRVHKEGHIDDESPCGTGVTLAEYLGVCWREYEQAADAARGARFEHGESGARK